MTSTSDVTLRAATGSDGELLGNLLELYVHDLSPMFPQVELGANGRFGYPWLPQYLDGTSDRWAWLIEQAGRTAGFVLARRGSPASDDPDVLDVAEFFVLRRFRGEGVGRAAARALWTLRPGTWIVRVAARNRGALSFWQGAVSSYLERRSEPSERAIDGKAWHVFQFESAR
jgi:predicted acetyltransferase